MDGERNYTKTILVTVILIIFVVIIAALIYIWKTQDQSPVETIKKVIEDITQVLTPTDSRKLDSEGEEDSINTPAQEPAGGGSDSGGGGSSSSGEGGSSCLISEVSYSLTNLIENSVCNVYDGEICTDKTISCSIDVRNREKIGEGHFNLILKFVESMLDPDTDSFKILETSLVVSPEEARTFQGETSVTSTGINGLANKKIKCFFNTVGQSYLEIC